MSDQELEAVAEGLGIDLDEIELRLANRSLGFLLLDVERSMRIAVEQFEHAVERLLEFDPEKPEAEYLAELEARLQGVSVETDGDD